MLTSKFCPSSEAESRRLMVVLHGLGDSSAGYEWMPEVLALPWLNYLLVNAPDDYYGGYSWYDLAGDPEPGVHRSRTMLNDLLDHLRSRGYPTEQTALFGFSQGCLMTLETGLRYPHRLAAMVGVSGYVLDPEVLLRELSPVARQQKVLVTHGTLDPMVPCAATRQRIQALQAGEVPIEWREFAKAHTIDDQSELPLIREFLVAAFGQGA
jgi:phospholipase/carboxylesterase